MQKLDNQAKVGIVLLPLLIILFNKFMFVSRNYESPRYIKTCIILGQEIDYEKSWIIKKETEPPFKKVAKWKTTCFIGTPKEKNTKKIETELEGKYELDKLKREVLQKEQELREKEEERELKRRKQVLEWIDKVEDR